MAMLDTAKKEELEEEERRYKKNNPMPTPVPSIESLDFAFAPSSASFASVSDSCVSLNLPGFGGGGAGGGLPAPAGGAPPPPPPAAHQRSEQSLQALQPSPSSDKASKQPHPAPSGQPDVGGSTSEMDYTQLPRQLDSNFDKYVQLPFCVPVALLQCWLKMMFDTLDERRYDKFNSLRATIVKLGSQYVFTCQPSAASCLLLLVAALLAP